MSTDRTATSSAVAERPAISPTVRSEQVLVRLTAAEKAQVDALADQLGIKAPDVFRVALTHMQLINSIQEDDRD